MMNFKELGLCDALLQAVEEQGYAHPMPVQEAVIPWLVNPSEEDRQKDLVALAQTGTGKTAAYGLPLLQLLQAEAKASPLARALILSPTRELCLQIADDLRGFSSHLEETKVLAVYGGANIEPQIRALRHGVDIIVATPGRLLDLMKRGAARLEEVEYVVLDEADEMLSMGFRDELNAILEGVPAAHRTLLFSATMSREIELIAEKYLQDAHQIVVGSRNEGAENVNHLYYMVRARDKYATLKRVVDYHPRIYAIVFCRTRMETQEVADNLIRDGYNADALHGELSQQQRDLTMQKFRQHRTQLLVATDVAARGLDVDDLTHVIHYGLPDDVENYTHRSGRTGRAGKKGTSICIINTKERAKVRQIEKVIRKDFVAGTMPEPREICTKQLYHVIDDIERVGVDEEEIAPFMDEVRKRWEWLDKEGLIKRILSREFGRFLRYYANAPEVETVDEKAAREGKKGKRGPRNGSHGAEEGYTRLFLNVGKIDGMYAREIIGLINSHVKGSKVEIGRIDLMKNFSFVEVAEADAPRVLKSLKHGVTVKGRPVVADLSDPQPSTHGDGRGKGRPQGRKDRTAQPKASRKGKKDKKAGDGSAHSPARSQRMGKEDWMKFFQDPENWPESPEAAEGWARRKPRKK